MQTTRVALVTGANRGIGLEIARQLAVQGMRVMLTARDPAKGQAAVDDLVKQGLTAEVHVLDVCDAPSIAALARALEQRYDRLDVLVNNAGILIDGNTQRIAELDPEMLHLSLETNLYGPLRVTQAMLPLMRKHAYGRIVNLSSGLGQLSDMQSGTPAYRVSKTALNALTRILAHELADSGIKVNAMCPGWVRTDMGGPNATRSVEVGADTAVWLAMLPEDGPTGGFFRDRKPIPW